MKFALITITHFIYRFKKGNRIVNLTIIHKQIKSKL